MKDTLLSIETPIYIAGHIIPDQDSICSCLALASILKNFVFIGNSFFYTEVYFLRE